MTLEEYTRKSRNDAVGTAISMSGLSNPIDNNYLGASATYTSYSKQKLLKKSKQALSSSLRSRSNLHHVTSRPSQNLQAVIEMHREQQNIDNANYKGKSDEHLKLNAAGGSGMSDAIFNQMFHYRRQESLENLEKGLKNAAKRNRRGLSQKLR